MGFTPIKEAREPAILKESINSTKHPVLQEKKIGE